MNGVLLLVRGPSPRLSPPEADGGRGTHGGPAPAARRMRLSLLASVAASLLIACQPAPQPSGGAVPGPLAAPTTQRGQKVLTVAIQREPRALGVEVGTSSVAGGA